MGKTSRRASAQEKYYYMYVLYCADNTLYTGYTTDLDRREKEHQSGKGAKYTSQRRRRPCRMLYSEAYATRSEAMAREAQFKKLTRTQKEAVVYRAGNSNLALSKWRERVDVPLSHNATNNLYCDK